MPRKSKFSKKSTHSDFSDSKMVRAGRNYMLQVIRDLLRSGGDLNQQDGNGFTLIFSAILAKDIPLIKRMVSKGADLEVKFGCGKEQGTPLLAAIGTRDLNVVRCLLDLGANIHTRFSKGDSYLHMLADSGLTGAIELLIKRGLNVNVRNSQEETPLHPAATANEIETVRMLLKYGADVNARSKTISDLTGDLFDLQGNVTAVYLAAGCGHIEMVKLLTEAGADVNVQTGLCCTPLHPPAQEGPLELVKILVEAKSDVNLKSENGRTAVHLAAKYGRLDIVEYLLTVEGVEMDSPAHEGETPLCLAAENGHLEIVKLLAAKGADINACYPYRFATPLSQAILASQQHVADWLTENGGDVWPRSKKKDGPPTHRSKVNDSLVNKQNKLFYAAGTNDIKTALSLLQSGANVNAQDVLKHTPLHIASKHGHSEMVALLLRYGADANIKGKRTGHSSLYIAVKLNFKDLVELILKFDADVNTANKHGVLPIHIASQDLNLDMVELLLSYGAFYNVEARAKHCFGFPKDFAQKANDIKLTAIFELIEKLFSAVTKNNFLHVESCIQAGAIVNARNSDGKTALHLAISNDNTKVTNLLLKHKANVTLATNEGCLPLHFAADHGNLKIVHILLSHSGKLCSRKNNSVINAKKINDGATALHLAVMKNNPQVVQLLLENGSMYNIENKAGETPLSLSKDGALKNLFNSAKKLFEALESTSCLVEEVAKIVECNKSIINVRDSNGGGTALYWSAMKGYTHIVNFLLKEGADYCLVTSKGTSPLHIASSKGYIEITRAIINQILKEGPDETLKLINSVTTSGSTPLHVAANKEIVCCLLQAGAAFNIQNRDGKTPKELTKNEDIGEFLSAVHQLFTDVERGTPDAENMLEDLDSEEFKAIISAQNDHGLTLLQVASSKANIGIVCKLTERLRCVN